MDFMGNVLLAVMLGSSCEILGHFCWCRSYKCSMQLLFISGENAWLMVVTVEKGCSVTEFALSNSAAMFVVVSVEIGGVTFEATCVCAF